MRQHFSADWAFGIRGAIENIVRRVFPSELRPWPLLQSFNFEAYKVGGDFFVMVLRDKLTGVPAGPGELKPFPYPDHPSLPLSADNVAEWLMYLVEKFSLRNEDAAMFLPSHDCGRNDAAADYNLFSETERALWDYQLQFTLARQRAAMPMPVHSSPNTPAQITYNLFGTSARVNINSSDSSVNIINQTPPEIFQQLLAEIRRSVSDVGTKQKN